MILEILHFPHPVLRKHSDDYDVNSIDKNEIKNFINNMQKTMYHYSGVGLAAPQVGLSKRLFIIDITQKIKKDDDGNVISHEPGKLWVFINPVIKCTDGCVQVEEGCLSVPGVYEDVKRYKSIEVDYYDENLELKNLKSDDFLAIAVQHENDHLDGKLFIDRLPVVKKTVIKNKILKGKTL